MHRVTVIIPANNEGIWCRQTIQSIIYNAGHPDYEIILVDDGSSDGGCDFANEKEFKDIVKLITVGRDEEHGPGFSRNRGLEAATGDLIITTDAHMIFSKNFMARFVELHDKYPKSFLISTSVGYRDVKDFRTIDLPNTWTQDGLKKMVEDLEGELKRPMLIDLPQLSEHEMKATYSNDTYKARQLIAANYGYPVFFVKTDHPTIHVKSWNIDETLPDGFMAYGCHLTIDKGDRDFITPKWTYYYNKKNQPHPNREVVPVGGVMGACYLFPKQLLIDNLGGWPRWSGWVNEEEYINIAAKITGIPIYCVPSIISAHNYDRLMGATPYENNLLLNKYSILEICFDDHKEDAFRLLFDKVPQLNYPAWVYDYQKRVQSHRHLTDREFIFESGLGLFFVPDERKRWLKMLNINPKGVGIDNAFDFAKIANLECVKRFLDGLSANEHLKSFFMLGVYQDEPHGTNKVPATEHTFQCININKWDYERNCRSNYISATEQAKLLGNVFQRLLLYSAPNSGLENFIGTVVQQMIESVSGAEPQADGGLANQPIADEPKNEGKIIQLRE